MNTPLQYFTLPQERTHTPSPFIINGGEITSLPMLLAQTTPEELYPFLYDHSLLHWLISQGQEHVAYALAQLLRTADFSTEFRSILGFPAAHGQELQEEELNAYEVRKNYISHFTDNSSILSNPYSVAINQIELNEILFLGTAKIYLCEDAFKVPTEITGVHYVGIGGAVIRQPLSKEEYAKYDITIEGIPLPEHSFPYKKMFSNLAPAPDCSAGYKRKKIIPSFLFADK